MPQSTIRDLVIGHYINQIADYPRAAINPDCRVFDGDAKSLVTNGGHIVTPAMGNLYLLHH